MLYRPLGRCGTKVSALGLGGWTTFGGSVRDERLISLILRAAFDAGVNLFDIADIYANGESERMMGAVLRELPRHRLVISTKLFWPMSDDVNDRGLSRKHVLESIDKSLKRIGTDYIDIYFCHRFDPETPMEETIRAMDDLVHQGKVIYWGTSEWSGAQLRQAHKIARTGGWHPPQVEQPQYSLLARARLEREVRPAAASLGMGLTTWSPLASGVLSGKYDEGVPAGSRLSEIDWLRANVLTEKNVKRVRDFKKYADALNCSRAQLAIAWVASQPHIASVLTGATRIEQLNENIQALSIQIPPATQRALAKLFA